MPDNPAKSRLSSRSCIGKAATYRRLHGLLRFLPLYANGVLTEPGKCGFSAHPWTEKTVRYLLFYGSSCQPLQHAGWIPTNQDSTGSPGGRMRETFVAQTYPDPPPRPGMGHPRTSSATPLPPRMWPVDGSATAVDTVGRDTPHPSRRAERWNGFAMRCLCWDGPFP